MTEREWGDGETAWLVYFEDQDKRPEIFTGRGAEEGAKARYLDARLAWSCHLFFGIAWSVSPDVEPTFRGPRADSAIVTVERLQQALSRVDRRIFGRTGRHIADVNEGSVEHAQLLFDELRKVI